jgi:deoxycytidylate deaminase
VSPEILHELQDFADKASGDRKTQVASCLVLANGRRIFGANHLRDDHNLTGQEIADRVRPKFYDAMKCSEADAIDKAIELGLDLTGATLYTLLFPCPRCATKIAKTKIKKIVARKHRVNHNANFDNPAETSRKILDEAHIIYDAGEPDEQ